jgi:hypothetical protein
MTQLPLIGYYSLLEACAALSSNQKQTYPEELLRHVKAKSLNLYIELDEALKDVSDNLYLAKLEFEFAKPHFGQIEMPDELLEIGIQHYQGYRSGANNGLLVIDFDNTHWYPTKIKMTEDNQVVDLIPEKVWSWEFSFRELFFKGEEISILIGLLQPQQAIKAKITPDSLVESSEKYSAAIRILAESVAGPIPESITVRYLKLLRKNIKSSEYSDNISENVQTWNNHLNILKNKGDQAIRDNLLSKLKTHMRYLSVEIAGPFNNGIPDEDWMTKFLSLLPEESRDRFSKKQWIEMLKN